MTTAAETTPATEAPRVKLIAFSAIMLVTLLAALDQSIVATALPRIVSSLKGFNDLSWIVTAYLLASTVTIPLYGKLSDLYGRRLLFVISISIFLTGSALCGFSQSMAELVAFRALQGLGAGGLVPLAQAAVGDLFSPRERGKYSGYVASMYGIAAVSGPLVGGTLTEAISWRWIFFVNLPLGIGALAVVIRTLAPNTRREHRIDFSGAITLGLSLCAILMAAAWAGAHDSLVEPRVIVAAALGLLGLLLFALIERRATEPMLPPILMRNRIFVTSICAYFIFGATLFAISIYGPVYLQYIRGNSPTISGLTMIAWSGPWTIAAVITGRLISRTGRYRIFPMIGSVMIVVSVALLTRVDLGTPRALLIVVLMIGGYGMGSNTQAYTVGTQNSIDPRMMGAGTAALGLFRAIGGSVSVSVLGAILASRTASVLTAKLGSAASKINVSSVVNGAAGHVGHTELIRHALLSGVHTVFLVAACVAAMGMVTALLLEERHLRTQSGSELRSAQHQAAEPRVAPQPAQATEPRVTSQPAQATEPRVTSQPARATEPRVTSQPTQAVEPQA